MPLETLFSQKEVVGVSRLLYLPSFAPEQIFTAIFKEQHIQLECIKGRSSLWGSIPQVTTSIDPSGMYRETGSIRFDKESCIRAHARVAYDAAPKMFSTVSVFADSD